MIVDVISFNSEKELYDIRYNVLKDFVDEFIVVEARHTFSGLDKPLYFEDIKDQYKNVYYHVIDESYTPEQIAEAQASPNTIGAAHWKTEFLQKEAIHKALEHLDDEDIVYIGDCDEIWKPKEIGEGVYKLKQLVYVYYLNQRSDEPWAGTFVGRYKDIKGKCLNHLRANSAKYLNKEEKWMNAIDDGGWHFTSMGGLEGLRHKLISSYTEEDYWNTAVQATIEENHKNNKDWLEGWDRPFKFWIDESQWPQYLKENKEKYAQLLLHKP